MTNRRSWIAPAALAFLGACGSPEQATIEQFFRAAQSKDSSTIAAMSAVAPPLEAESWKVVEVSSRTTEPFTLPELLEKFEVVKKERDAETELRTKFAKDNKDALEQIIPKLRSDPEFKFKGKLGEIQEEWTKQLEERNEKERAYQALKRTVNEESNLAGKSVMRQADLGKLRGSIAVTEMLLNLKPLDGAELPFKVTLRKYDLTDPEAARPEPARWVISDIEGTTEEARAAATAPAKPGERASEAAAAAESTPVAEKASSAEAVAPERNEPTHPARELRGAARVQILTPKSEVVGSDVVTTIRARNASKDWIAGFMVTEHWYDQQGTAVGSSSKTHRDRFMPGEVLEIQLRTRKGPNFYQSQYEFSHANGAVTATTVASFPEKT